MLVTSGPFRIVRHPTDGGTLLVFCGASLVVGVYGRVGCSALGVLWWWKSTLEECLLVDRYPQYVAYRHRVRRRFVPGGL